MEPTDFKNVIVENINWALPLEWSACLLKFRFRKLSFFKFVSSLEGWMLKIWKMKVFRIRQSKFQNHLIFITFYNRIFVVLNFEVVWPRRPRRPRKEPSEYFQRLHFWNQFVPLIKMHYRVGYSLDFDLKIRSGQGCVVYLTELNFLVSVYFLKAQKLSKCAARLSWPLLWNLFIKPEQPHMKFTYIAIWVCFQRLQKYYCSAISNVQK